MDQGTTLRRFAAAITRSPADTDDLVQDVLERAWRNRRTFRSESALSTWLYRIAINRARDVAARAENQRTEPSGTGDIDGPISDLEHPETVAQALSDRSTVRAALATLTVEDRMVLALHDGEGWTATQIGAVGALTTAAVYKRIHRARVKLLRALDNGPAHPRNDSQACRRTLAAASDYLDGRLDVDASARIDTHLRQCRRCPPIAQALIGIKTALGLRPWTSAVPEQFVCDVAHLGGPRPPR
ncbi:sigma-70 family RNA polymerase sigma factor [Gordonia polyisoprenivorans]|nr:sigma-70 family RNA polymerase sigma factor [Gordonia sp. BP-119]MBN0984725.1 sigma-70 family RNA polymerase sigma factor [Gordonia sp. BP-94]MBR7195203.1 sigma-70 family RNA polymerase sigma factor [Gordonia sp. SCSIO 19800]QUD85714.1 sigma-70 family RNA polymerase sigma factor [Gordonia polyisoprenivorans]